MEVIVGDRMKQAEYMESSVGYSTADQQTVRDQGALPNQDVQGTESAIVLGARASQRGRAYLVFGGEPDSSLSWL